MSVAESVIFRRPASPLGVSSASPLDDETSVSVEQELVRRALAGNGAAFADLVRPHLPMLYRIAARACGDGALAEDAVQEALTLVYARLRKYRPDTSLKAFLAAFAARQAQTLLRSERRRRVREDNSSAPDASAEPHEVLTAMRTMQRVRAALARLPEKRRQVALLRLDADLSYAEIAQVVGSTEGSARVLVHLALKELREALQDVLTEGA